MVHGKHMVCVSVCVLYGYIFRSCGAILLASHCSSGCYGLCDDQGKCECKLGWYGERCLYTNDCRLNSKDRNYQGNIKITKDGFPCLNWRKYDVSRWFSMDHSYCRTPNGDPLNTPWCFINNPMDSAHYYEVCNVSICECKPGRFGENCEKSCHCKSPGCDLRTGHCVNSECEDRWNGPSCDKCNKGYFGKNCDEECHCKTPGCARKTGRCNDDGCQDGWTGESCNKCLHQNRFGNKCEKSCHCQSGHCDIITGICSNSSGCQPRWTGQSCNYTTDCMLDKDGDNYHGTINITKSGLPCKLWKYAPSRYHVLEENYCRVTSLDTDLNVPWCYTVSGKPRYQTCSIPVCVCQPGYFGQNCENQCHCAANGCNITTGECYDQKTGCIPTWVGNNCSLRIPCPDLRHITNMKQPSNLTGYHYPDSVSFKCRDGYTILGNTTLKCMPTGEWNDQQPACAVVSCPKLVTKSGQREPTKLTGYQYSDYVNFLCQKGYTLEGRASISCEASGHWSHHQPSCKESSDHHEQRNGVSYAVYGGTTAAIVVLAITAVIILVLWMRRQVKQKERVYEDIRNDTGQQPSNGNPDEAYTELSERSEYWNTDPYRNNTKMVTDT